jgi:hypothetical protein
MHKHQLVICHFMLSLHETFRYVPKTHLSFTTVFIMMYFEVKFYKVPTQRQASLHVP